MQAVAIPLADSGGVTPQGYVSPEGVHFVAVDRSAGVYDNSASGGCSALLRCVAGVAGGDLLLAVLVDDAYSVVLHCWLVPFCGVLRTN